MIFGDETVEQPLILHDVLIVGLCQSFDLLLPDMLSLDALNHLYPSLPYQHVHQVVIDMKTSKTKINSFFQRLFQLVSS
jgi:hypothetical protein